MLPGMGFAVLFARFRSACDKRMEFLYNENSFQTRWVPLSGRLGEGFDFNKEESSVKKFVSAILVMLLVFSSFAALSENAAPPADGAGNNPPPLPPHIKEQADVVAVFAGIEKQPFRLENQPEEDQKVDTVWIYYSDNTFDQYAELRHEFELFSTGKYSFTEGGSFGPEGKDGSIVIERTQKYSLETGRLADYSSSHEYKLGSLGFTQIYGPETGKEIEAITGDNKLIEYKDEAGVRTRLDSIWLYFTDGTFVDYVFLRGEVVANGLGTFYFDRGGDFHVIPTEEDQGVVQLSWEKSLTGLAGEIRTYDLSTWSEFLYEKHDPELMQPQ